jgi:hypothetical protein
MASVARNDADGILADQLIEIRTILDDVWGPAESWPETEDIDGYHWELTEPLPLEPEPGEEPAPYEPSEEDRSDQAHWAQRWAEYEAWLDHLERDYPAVFPDDSYLSDDDITAGGLAVG